MTPTQTTPEEQQYLNDHYTRIRYGIRIHFDIYAWLNKNYTLKEKTGIIFIQGNQYDLHQVYSEIEIRTSKCKQWLEDNLDSDILDSLTSPGGPKNEH